MTIAVHIPIPYQQKDIGHSFLYRAFVALANTHPLHNFILISDAALLPAPAAANITTVQSGPRIKNRLLQHYFYNFKIPRLLLKHAADVFVSSDVCSLRTNIPQYLVIRDLSFLQKSSFYGAGDIRYLKRFTPAFIKKAENVLTLNESLRDTLVKSYKLAQSKIKLIGIDVDPACRPSRFTAAEAFRNSFTDGRQYFIYFGTAAGAPYLITMLKAFSLFKKWQKSNMQLVILLFAGVHDKEIKSFSTYKHRDDVKLINAETTSLQVDIIASAYAAVQLSNTEITETEGLNAMACGLPLVTINTPFSRSVYHDAALYCEPVEKDISEKMMLLYKDEQSRNTLIQKGTNLAAQHTIENTVAGFWKTFNFPHNHNLITLQKDISNL